MLGKCLVDKIRGTYHLPERPEIPHGKSNGLRHYLWEASECRGFFLGNAIFPLLFSLFSLCGYTLPADCSPTTSNFIVLPIYAQDVYPGGLSKW